MFVRTMLAMSLSCIIAGTAFAASATEQPLNPKKVATDVTVQDPIDPLATEASAAKSTDTPISAQEQSDLTQASETLDGLQAAEDQNADIGAAPTAAAKSTSAHANKASWTLDGLNNAEWYEDIGKGQFPVYARAHVMLNNAHASPGAIDGTSGKNTLKALASFQQMNGIKPTGTLTKETWDKLIELQASKSAFVEYTISAEDLKIPLAKSIPSDYALQAKMPGLYYTSMSEMLAEKFHMDEAFLKQLNPGANFSKAGQKLLVANVRNNLPEDIHLIVAHKGAKQLYLFNSKNKMIASFPASIGNTSTPSPTGTYKVTGVARNPYYSYSPSNFVQGNNTKPLSLPPGPNGPVGNIWIGLSKKSFGIHGTPNPSMISKSYSHGCIRLTNWDANDLGRKVKSGVTVRFLE